MRNPLPAFDNLGVLLQGCMKVKALQPGKQIHAQLLGNGVDMEAGALSAKLVGMYAGCGDVSFARQVFDRMPKPTVFAWNWMISSLAFQGDCESAIGYFSQMRKMEIDGVIVFPNKFTFSSVLKACVGLLDIKKGEEMHCSIIKMGFESDITVVNALIDMYCKCGRVGFARELFDRMTERDVASWTSMICGYSHSGSLKQALALFEQMSLEGLEPNEFTWNVVISGYAHSGDCHGAFKLFDRMTTRGLTPDLVTWNAMITGLVRSNRNLEALTLFSKMLALELKPNPVTISGLLPAFGSTGDIHKGKQVHGLSYRRLLNLNTFAATALIDMYSKCGYVKDARNVFDEMQVKNVALWNAMIGCYGKHGKVEDAIVLFERMSKEGVQANQVTYTSMLSACSHGGLVNKGLEIFNSMKENGEEHYACLVDLLSRAEKLEEAYEVIKEIPVEVNESIVGAFLNGCRMHGRSDLAKKMAEEVVGMEVSRAGGFVTLSNIYAAEGEWGWVENVRKVMKGKGVCKMAGSSWVERKDGFVGLASGHTVP